MGAWENNQSLLPREDSEQDRGVRRAVFCCLQFRLRPLCLLPWGLVLSHTHLQCGRCRFDPWVGKIPWRRTWQPTPVFLPGESHGQRSLVGYGPWDRKESDMTERLILSLHCHPGKRTDFPFSNLGLGDPRDPCPQQLCPQGITGWSTCR